ncbi:hypothetical protein Ccrd_007491 [Cynara cardunculus var. scolymus]|uniref:Uncharacterized protein n=1 Tax=Cynara cardunculus var. scolymus TaxID=59895 RepID=A0A103XGQ9_CYNCS|nr:hypothetical protein Ccrd_007491 [Cynara cardunculus var. scolymus]
MWQVLLAAALAGSGYFAKNLLHKNDKEPTNCFDLPTEIPPSSVENADAEASNFNEETSSIFRFSSASQGSKSYRKKLGHGGGIKGKRGNHEKTFGSVKKMADGFVDDQRKSGRKFAVCLKKRRTGRNASAKCDSFDVKDKSSFGWGVGVGIMYMMSAGKAEIERLNTAVDETAKVVQELKVEISKRKSSCDLKVERTTNQKRMDTKWDQSVLEKSDMENSDIEVYGSQMADEGGYASSIVTEEPHQEALEMDQLEAELQSELLKLHVSTAEDLYKPQDLDQAFNQCNGVIPSELDQKLCHLLIEQQESQIVDLESELQCTNSKLLEKESELQALKDCVKRLTDFSLTCPSDEEKEGQVEEVHGRTIDGNGKPAVGTKRAIDFD